MQSLDDGVIVLLRALDHSRERIGKPLLEVLVRGEDVRHKEMHQRPQLHEGVLKRRSRQQQSVVTGQPQQCLPPLRLEVLDVLRLNNQQHSRLMSE